MKRWPSAAAMMGAVLLTHAAARADNLPGFQNTRWGMTEQQVQEIYDGKLENWEIFTKSPTSAIPSRTFKQFGLKHYDVEGCDFTVSFHFGQTGLSMVSLSLINTKKN